MHLLVIRYKVKGKIHRTRVTYKASANIIAGLIMAGAIVLTAIGDDT